MEAYPEDMRVTLEQARKAKAKAKLLAEAASPGAAVGLAKVDDSYVVKVNLSVSAPGALPQSVDGVPMLYEVVGRIRVQSAD